MRKDKLEVRENKDHQVLTSWFVVIEEKKVNQVDQVVMVLLDFKENQVNQENQDP